MSVRMELDMKHKVETLEELSMCDPYDTEASLEKAILYWDACNFYMPIYPEEVVEGMRSVIMALGRAPPPKVIFMPTRELTRKMIRALLDFG